MSASAGRPGEPPRLRQIPPGAPTRRLPSEPSGHGDSHLYAYIRGVQHELGHERQLSSADGWILDAMAARTNRDGTMRGSLRELAKDLDRGISTIRRHVKRLVELGFVEDLGTCAEDNRHRQWRIAGMNRLNRTKSPAGDNHPGGHTKSRARAARPPLESRAPAARFRAELPEELIEPTRASTQQGGERPREGTPRGVQASREALARRRALSGGCDGPGAPAGPSDDGQGPSAALSGEDRSQDGAEGSAGSAPGGAPRSVTDDAGRCPIECDALPSCSAMDTNPDDYEPEVPDDPDVDEPGGPEPETEPAPFPAGPETEEPAESPPAEPATSGI